jgi:hypothetical protein
MVSLPAMKLVNRHPIDAQFQPDERRQGLKDDGRGRVIGFTFIAGNGFLMFRQVLPYLTLNLPFAQIWS